MNIREVIAASFSNPAAARYVSDCAAYLFGREIVDSHEAAKFDAAHAAAHEAAHAVVCAIVGLPASRARMVPNPQKLAGYVAPHDDGRPLFSTLPEIWRRTCIAMAGFMGERTIAEAPKRYSLLTSAHDIAITIYYAKVAEVVFARVTANAVLRAALNECRTMLEENLPAARRLRDLLTERGELSGEEIAKCLHDVKPISPARWQALLYAGGGKAEYPEIEAALPIAHAIATGGDYAAQMEEPSPPQPLSAIEGHERAAFLFGGGKDGLCVANMLKPYRDRVTMLYVNTGAMLPSQTEFVREYARTAGFHLVELHSNQAARFASAGLPSKIIPVINSKEAFKTHPLPADRPMLTDWRHCCFDLRTRPAWQWMQMHGVSALIHGQRADDNVASWIRPPLVNVAPLHDWTEADVYAYIEANRIALPIQYATGYRDSGECWNCTAELGADRIAWIKRAYPERMPVLRALLGTVAGAVRAEIDKAQPGLAEAMRP